MPMNKYATAADIISNVLGQFALPIPSAIVSAVGDATATQMVYLLNYAGRKLVKPTASHRWRTLTKEWVLITDPLETLYPLPTDWDSFEDLTGWNFTSRFPMLGPATDPQWQTLKARNLGSSTISVVYRLVGRDLELYNSFSTPQDLRIVYASRSWVYNPGTLQYKDQITADDDECLFDRDLLTNALRLEFLIAKGFDTTVAQADFNDMVEKAICADEDAPVLSVNVNDSYPLLTTQFNAPDTNYGA
jgi:hypothetical protein